MENKRRDKDSENYCSTVFAMRFDTQRTSLTASHSKLGKLLKLNRMDESSIALFRTLLGNNVWV